MKEVFTLNTRSLAMLQQAQQENTEQLHRVLSTQLASIPGISSLNQLQDLALNQGGSSSTSSRPGPLVIGALLLFVSMVFLQARKMDAFLILCCCLQGLSLTSSSFIENEHVVCFFLFNSYMLYHLSFKQALPIIVCARVLHSRLQVINFARLNGLTEPCTLE